MYTTTDLLLFLISMICIAFLIYLFSKKKQFFEPPPIEIVKNLLETHVRFYQQLNATDKIKFESRVLAFLKKIRITGVSTTVEDMDRVLIAAAGIVPIFAFEGWEYRNLHEVLVYPGSFREDFQIEGSGRDVLGMVGNGAMQNVMVISQHDLRKGFQITSDTSNTAIHEFVHLMDQTDGSIDGNIEALLPHQFALPFLKRIHQEMDLIKNGQSDLNPYGTKNEAEFLAVAAEYFFEQPQLMEQKHPELFELLKQLFEP